jgi:hypothetical protein
MTGWCSNWQNLKRRKEGGRQSFKKSLGSGGRQVLKRGIKGKKRGGIEMEFVVLLGKV